MTVLAWILGGALLALGALLLVAGILSPVLTDMERSHQHLHH